MQVFALVAAASLAVVSAQAPPCDIAKLREITTGPNGKTCQEKTGWSVLSLSVPEGDKLKQLCGEATCKSFLAEMTAAIPTECVVGSIPVKATLIDKFVPACAAVGAGPTTAPTAPTTAPTAPTTAPTATTTAPAATTKAPEAATAAPAATTKTPEATTKAPEATTKAPEATTVPPVEETTSGSQNSTSGSMSGSKSMEESEVTTAPVANLTKEPTTAPPKSGASTVVAAAGAIVAAVAASFF